jgi:adenosylmethionine-8-amino-7-oxononanoate aminotransferase
VAVVVLEAGIILPPKDYLTEVQKLCKKCDLANIKRRISRHWWRKFAPLT